MNHRTRYQIWMLVVTVLILPISGIEGLKIAAAITAAALLMWQMKSGWTPTLRKS